MSDTMTVTDIVNTIDISRHQVTDWFRNGLVTGYRANGRLHIHTKSVKDRLEMLTTADVEHLYGVDRKIIQYHVKRGNVPATRFGRRLLISKEDAELMWGTVDIYYTPQEVALEAGLVQVYTDLGTGALGGYIVGSKCRISQAQLEAYIVSKALKKRSVERRRYCPECGTEVRLNIHQQGKWEVWRCPYGHTQSFKVK